MVGREEKGKGRDRNEGGMDRVLITHSPRQVALLLLDRNTLLLVRTSLASRTTHPANCNSQADSQISR